MNQREIQCRERRFLVCADRHAEFWDLFASGFWEPETIDVLERHLGAGRQFVDIGSWIGPLSLFAAALGSPVLAFEPDPLARQDLEDNIALNPGLAPLITVDPRAVGSRERTLSMTGGEVGLGESVSRLGDCGRRTNARPPVRVVDIRTLVGTDAFRNCKLLKCDIEGGEYAAIPRLRKYLREVGPPLLISLHGYDLLDRMVWAPRRLRLAWLRAVQGVRRERIFWAVASYDYVYRWSSGERWKRLRALDRFPLAVRFSESEIYCDHVPI
jgi:FkbM family methyltransferase